MNKTFKAKIAGAAVAALALGGFAIMAAPVASATTSITGVTYLPDNLDSGNGAAVVHGLKGGWAIDTFHRALTVMASSDCTSLPALYSCFSATASDTGTFKTIPGNGDAPNPSSTTDPGTNLAFPPVSGPFSGTASYLFEANAAPDASNIAGVVNNGGVAATGKNSTSFWFEQAFSGATFLNSNGTTFTGAIQNNWSWSYTSRTGASATTTAVNCENWTDSAANGAGATASDGNITGTQCAGTPIPAIMKNLGDYANSFGNGFDVYQQNYAANHLITGWTATKGDPATHFIRNPNPNGGWSLEAVNAKGIATGLCVSDPIGSEPAGFMAGQLTLRGCNNSIYQGFSQPGGNGTQLNSDTGAGHVEPNGTGAPLVVTTAFDGWGGYKYTWTDIRHLP